MAANAPVTPNATPAPDGIDETPAPDETQPSGGTTLAASVVGNLITLSGTGFEAGQKYDVRFQRPDGAIDSTLATAQEDGSLATYATVRGTGKHEAWLEVLGKKIANLKFKV